MEQLAEFAGNHVLLVTALLGAFGLVAAYELRLRAQGVTHVSPGDAVKLINKSALIVDVRSPEAFGGGHIVNARNLPLAELAADPESLKKSKTKILLTVCESGAESGKAASLLRKAGYENAFSIRGGIRAWRAENLPLAK
ncbi:MAG TPA: rhodanese-like domain-containing protein [Gammaproteobacteria bacterium]|nr:rhodanese-like domain-containing protein [Gammaproteobacteria bacterium]